MSRTNKKKKPIGYEYWGRRPGSIYSPGSKAKKETHKRERMINKKLIFKLKKELNE